MLEVEVVYARPDVQRRYRVRVPDGATVAEAVRLSGALQDFSAIDLPRDGVALFGRRVPLDRVLQSGDRVEILRPLLIDPQSARRLRALRRAR